MEENRNSKESILKRIKYDSAILSYELNILSKMLTNEYTWNSSDELSGHLEMAMEGTVHVEDPEHIRNHCVMVGYLKYNLDGRVHKFKSLYPDHPLNIKLTVK